MFPRSAVFLVLSIYVSESALSVDILVTHGKHTVRSDDNILARCYVAIFEVGDADYTAIPDDYSSTVLFALGIHFAVVRITGSLYTSDFATAL